MTLLKFLDTGFKRPASSISRLLECSLSEPWATIYELWQTQGWRPCQWEAQVERLDVEGGIPGCYPAVPGPSYLSYPSWEAKRHQEKTRHPGHTLCEFLTHRLMIYNNKIYLNPLCFGVVFYTAIDNQNKERTNQTRSSSSKNLWFSNWNNPELILYKSQYGARNWNIATS